MSFAKWGATASAVLIVGAAASWWIPRGSAELSGATAVQAAKIPVKTGGAAALPPVSGAPQAASQVVVAENTAAQDDEAVRKTGLVMLQQALRSGSAREGGSDTGLAQSIAWPIPKEDTAKALDVPITQDPSKTRDAPKAKISAAPQPTATVDDHLGAAAYSLEPRAADISAAPTASDAIPVSPRSIRIGHREATVAKPHKTVREETAAPALRRIAQDKATAPKPHKTTEAEYIERVIEQGDAGTVTYRDVRHRCEPPNMVDVCYMPAQNRRSIVIERW